MEGDQRNQTHKIVSLRERIKLMCATQPMELEDFVIELLAVMYPSRQSRATY